MDVHLNVAYQTPSRSTETGSRLKQVEEVVVVSAIETNCTESMFISFIRTTACYIGKTRVAKDCMFLLILIFILFNILSFYDPFPLLNV